VIILISVVNLKQKVKMLFLAGLNLDLGCGIHDAPIKLVCGFVNWYFFRLMLDRAKDSLKSVEEVNGDQIREFLNREEAVIPLSSFLSGTTTIRLLLQIWI
jgi:hypothetical protein